MEMAARHIGTFSAGLVGVGSTGCSQRLIQTAKQVPRNDD
jgi:hypothetical protein